MVEIHYLSIRACKGGDAPSPPDDEATNKIRLPEATILTAPLPASTFNSNNKRSAARGTVPIVPRLAMEEIQAMKQATSSSYEEVEYKSCTRFFVPIPFIISALGMMCGQGGMVA